MARTDFQLAVDSLLTKHLNNKVANLRQLLLNQLATLNDNLKTTFGNNVRFFVKGGNALNVLKNPDISAVTDLSDWDTQIIINPNLPVIEWHQYFLAMDLFLKAQLKTFQTQLNDTNYSLALTEDLTVNWKKDGNAVNAIFRPNLKSNQLNSYASIYSRILHPKQTIDNFNSITENSKQVILIPYLKKNIPVDEQADYLRQVETYFPYTDINSSKEARTGQSSSWIINTSIDGFYLYRLVVRYESVHYDNNGTKFDDPITDSNKSSFRGELIDISIPRRDTLEALHQWQHVNIFPLSVKYAAPDHEEIIQAPDWDYHLEENIIMIMEYITEISNSPHKLPSRIKRGLEALKKINDPTDAELKLKYPNLFDPSADNGFIRQLAERSLLIQATHLKKYFLKILQGLVLDFKARYLLNDASYTQMCTIMFDAFDTSNQIPGALQAEINKIVFEQAEKAELEQFVRIIILENNLINIILKPQDDIYWRTILRVCSFMRQINMYYLLDTYLSIELFMNDKAGKNTKWITRGSNSLVNESAPLVKIKVHPGSEVDAAQKACVRLLNFLKEEQGITYAQKAGEWIWITVKDAKPIYIKFQDLSKNRPGITIRGYNILSETELIARVNQDIIESNSFIRMNSLKNLKDAYYKALVTFPEPQDLSLLKRKRNDAADDSNKKPKKTE
jgi:hypothetical protein